MDMLFAAFESSDLSGTKTLAHCSRAATRGRHSSDGSIGEGEMRKLPHQRWPGKHAASDELLKNEVRHPPQSGWLDELGRLKGGWRLLPGFPQRRLGFRV